MAVFAVTVYSVFTNIVVTNKKYITTCSQRNE